MPMTSSGDGWDTVLNYIQQIRNQYPEVIEVDVNMEVKTFVVPSSSAYVERKLTGLADITIRLSVCVLDVAGARRILHIPPAVDQSDGPEYNSND